MRVVSEKVTWPPHVHRGWLEPAARVVGWRVAWLWDTERVSEATSMTCLAESQRASDSEMNGCGCSPPPPVHVSASPLLVHNSHHEPDADSV